MKINKMCQNKNKINWNLFMLNGINDCEKADMTVVTECCT